MIEEAIQLGIHLNVPPAPDALFETDNEWGIPLLRVTQMPTFIVAPVTKWGDAARTSHMPGTYQFYVDDYKFTALWKRPEAVVKSGCAAAIEPNFSTNDQMARAVVLWRTYQKRWIARYWQSYNIQIFVDLYTAPRYHDISLLGVPKGWRAYATRGLSKHIGRIEVDYARAIEHAGDLDIVFLVYGGGKEVELLCREMGVNWIPENQKVKDGSYG